MKKLVSITSTVALLSSMLMPLAGADNTSGNAITGYGSTNVSNVTNTNTATVNNVSDTKIVNVVDTVSSTGGNSASFNTLGGLVSSGNASNIVGISNTGNINTTSVRVGTSGDNQAGNSITGALSTNKSDVLNTNKVKVYNDNTAWVSNYVDATSTTGGNTASYNTGAGSALSGNAVTNVAVANHLNDSATQVQLGMGGLGGNSATNSTTGALSTNIAGVVNSNDVEINNVSDARILNHVRAVSDTGLNSSSYNTLGGHVSSGNAATGVGLDTTANINTNTVAVAMGGFANAAGSEITGASSTNISGVNNSNVFKVDNWNNKGLSTDAKDYRCGFGYNPLDDEEGVYSEGGDYLYRPKCWGVYNYDFDSAVTGGNTGDFNTGLASVLSGVATIQKTVRTWMNDNFNGVN